MVNHLGISKITIVTYTWQGWLNIKKNNKDITYKGNQYTDMEI